jgi:transposase-like protein
VSLAGKKTRLCSTSPKREQQELIVLTAVCEGGTICQRRVEKLLNSLVEISHKPLKKNKQIKEANPQKKDQSQTSREKNHFTFNAQIPTRASIRNNAFNFDLFRTFVLSYTPPRLS